MKSSPFLLSTTSYSASSPRTDSYGKSHECCGTSKIRHIPTISQGHGVQISNNFWSIVECLTTVHKGQRLHKSFQHSRIVTYTVLSQTSHTTTKPLTAIMKSTRSLMMKILPSQEPISHSHVHRCPRTCHWVSTTPAVSTKYCHHIYTPMHCYNALHF